MQPRPVFAILISFVFGPSTAYRLELILGESLDGYFGSFDMIFGGRFDPLTKRINIELEHETVQQYSNGQQSHNFSSVSNVDTAFWKKLQLFMKNNESLAIFIALEEIESLNPLLNEIKTVLNIDHTRKTPYFFLLQEKPLSDLQISSVQSNSEAAQGFEIDSDVYLIYPKCLKDSDKGEQMSTISMIFCPSGQAEVKRLEFYSVKNQSFIEPVEFILMDTKVPILLAQKMIRRTNFRKSPLKSIAAFGYPFRAKFNENNDSFVSGYEAEQIRFLGDSYNLSVKVGVASGWMDELPNGSLSGMGGEVINGEVDISISASEILPYRVQKLTFLHPTYYTRLWGFFVQPPSSSFRDIFIHAFAGDLWLTMFSTWVLIIFAMGALAIVKRRLDTMHENDNVLIQELIIWAMGAVCQQGWHVCPESTCMKIIFIFALITGLVSYVAYSAALVSILSVKVVPIRKLSDIVNHRYTIYQDNQTIHAQYVIRELEASGQIPCMSQEERSIRSEVALPLILSGSSAFIGSSDFFYPTSRNHMNDTEICNLISKISITSRPIRGGMFVKKGSPLKDFLNHKVLIMYERGIRFRLLENYFRESSVMCLEKSGATKDPLGFNDVYTAFVILLMGHCLSFAIFVIERMFPPAHHDKESLFPSKTLLATITENFLTLSAQSKNSKVVDFNSTTDPKPQGLSLPWRRNRNSNTH